jgi:hypothetical protein
MTPQQQEYIITEDEKQRVDGWLSSMGKTTIRSRPAPLTKEKCENRDCLECRLHEKCFLMEDMPMCAKATYDTACKKAATAAREQVLDEMLKWAQDTRNEQQVLYENGRYIHPRVVKGMIDQIDAVVWKIASLRSTEEQP